MSKTAKDAKEGDFRSKERKTPPAKFTSGGQQPRSVGKAIRKRGGNSKSRLERRVRKTCEGLTKTFVRTLNRAPVFGSSLKVR